MNYFEKIKAMNIDEMAILFSYACQTNMNIDCSDCLCGDVRCLENFKHWLEREAE